MFLSLRIDWAQLCRTVALSPSKCETIRQMKPNNFGYCGHVLYSAFSSSMDIYNLWIISLKNIKHTEHQTWHRHFVCKKFSSCIVLACERVIAAIIIFIRFRAIVWITFESLSSLRWFAAFSYHAKTKWMQSFSFPTYVHCEFTMESSFGSSIWNWMIFHKNFQCFNISNIQYVLRKEHETLTHLYWMQFFVR